MCWGEGPIWEPGGRSASQESSTLVNRFLKSLPLETTQYMREKDVMHSGWEEIFQDCFYFTSISRSVTVFGVLPCVSVIPLIFLLYVHKVPV